MTKEIINIPDLGEAEDVEVIEICVKAGDQVDSEDPIIVLESDKAAMEIPASVVGKLFLLKYQLVIPSVQARLFCKSKLQNKKLSMRKKMLQSKRLRKIKLSSEKVEEIESKPH